MELRVQRFNDHPMIDYKLEAIVPDELRDLLPTFLANRKKDVQVLQQALSAEDFEQLRHIGHRMKGVGESYGFQHVSVLGGEIELHARERKAHELARLLEEYADYLQNVKISFAAV